MGEPNRKRNSPMLMGNQLRVWKYRGGRYPNRGGIFEGIFEGILEN
jgi:hypothetical protein